jgi:hypothetical protein
VEDGDDALAGGVANAGAVFRRGTHVLRPSNEHSPSILSFLSQLESVGFDGAPSPIDLEPDGRERLRFIPGEVAVPPYPSWAQSDEALESIAVLIRRLHDASEAIDTSAMSWSSEMADPEGGPVVCHNDVCLENVVFRDGGAVALLDFDFAAPGRRAFDVAAFARMCVPIDDEVSAARLGWRRADRPRRLRLVCDAYGFDVGDRIDVLKALQVAIAAGGEFVRRHAEAGEPGFVKMWAEIGGMERFDRRRRWWTEAQGRYEAALR